MNSAPTSPVLPTPPAGTKRLSNLLRSPAWAPALLHRWLWARAHRELQTLVASGHQPLAIWVVARRGKGQEPWCLLTSEMIVTVEDAWKVALAYARRGQIEQTWRANKSERALESPRVWEWERREKPLLLVTLVYAFLLSLVMQEALCTQLLRMGCHRTGERHRTRAVPLYRLRSALSHLWRDHPPAPLKRR